ncbi:MAG: hypothetical protein ACTHPO_04730 [Alphaproteobacteria bacterium]
MPFNPSEIMHMNELNAWTQPYAELSGQTREQVIGDIINIWQDEGRLVGSGELAEKLTEKYLDQKGINESAKEQILADIRDIEAIKRDADHTTGVLKKDHKGVETALSHIYAKETGRPVMMLEFDFGNMGGTNELFQKKFAIEKFQQEHGYASFSEAETAFKGMPLEDQKKLIDDINIKQTFSKTDMAAKIVTQSVYSDLQAHFPDSQVTAIRTGGDELRFIVEGVEPSKYNDIIMAATHNVEIKMAELGLLDHEHAKGRENRFKDGFGGGLAAKDMREINDPDNIIAQMDEDVKAHKDSIGEVRVGDHINVEETVKRNFGIALDTDISTLPQAEQQRFNEAVEKQKYILEKNADNIRAHAPDPAQTIAEFDQRSVEILAEVDRTPTTDVNDPTLKTANVDGLQYEQYATIEERRSAYMEQQRVPAYEAANGGQLDESIKRFMDHEARSLNPMDPSAGVNTVNDYYENAKLWHAAAGDGPKPSTMFVGFQNLGGLNNLLGHDGADAVLTDMAKIVKTSLTDAGIESDKFIITHNGGGEFRLLVQPGFEDQLKTAQQSIADRTAALNGRDIAGYLADKGIQVDGDTQAKIAGKDFSSVEDPKVRVTSIDGHKIEGYADGLAVLSAQSEMEIAPRGTEGKSWDVDHVLTEQKKHLDSVVDDFRHDEILKYQGLDDNSLVDPSREYKAERTKAATTDATPAAAAVNATQDNTVEAPQQEAASPTTSDTSEAVQAKADTPEPAPSTDNSATTQDNAEPIAAAADDKPTSSTDSDRTNSADTEKIIQTTDTPDAPDAQKTPAASADMDTPTSGKSGGFSSLGTSSAGIGMSVIGMKNALERGDETGIAVASADMTVSSADLILDGANAMGREVSSGLRGMATKANILITAVDGVYQISQEEGLENKTARGAAVVVTTGTAMTVGVAASTVVATGALATTAVVAAPIAAAVTVGMATDAGVDAYKAQRSFEASIERSEQANKTAENTEPSGAPALQNYSNLRYFAIVESESLQDGTNLSRQELARKANEYAFSQDPEALDLMQDEIQAKVEHYDKIIEENDSWVPDFTRFFGQDEVQAKMDAQIERAKYVAALNELKEYRGEVADYEDAQSAAPAQDIHQEKDGLSGDFQTALDNDAPDLVADSSKHESQLDQDDIDMDDLKSSFVSMHNRTDDLAEDSSHRSPNATLSGNGFGM